MTRLGAAVVGTGFIGPVHVEGLQRAGVRVTGILGSSPEKSRQAAESLGLPKGYPHLAALLADPEVQSVHLTTPNRFHFEQVRAALAAGKHVVCEKPLAMTPAESSELVRLARNAGVAAGVNYNIRYYPLSREAADRVRKGELGRVYHVSGDYVQDWLFHETDYNWRVMAGEGGALRAVADIGTHWLDLVLSITGLEVEAVCADLQTVHPVRRRPRGEVETFSGKFGAPRETEPVTIATEDAGAILLRFKGGAKGWFGVSQVTAGRKNCVRYEIAGSKEAMAWTSERPEELWIGHRDRPNEILVKDPALAGDLARGAMSYPGGHAEGFPDTVKQLCRSFYGYVAGGNFSAPAPFPTFEDGHRELVLCDAILRSHRESRWIPIPGVPV
ncbi:MAG TPA: Gfo/Idh/MocA family oxidoreductase [Planctomycetota bacterium]|nr:Gfo/Idh/MocA family oxidoreductase [Planctomycetota bacterium]